MGLSTPAPSRSAALLLAAAVSAGPAFAQTPPQPSNNPPGLIELPKPRTGDPAAEPLKPVRTPNAGGYKLEQGPITISEVPAAVLKDPARDKSVEVRVRYSRLSRNAGPYPVLIVSHGAGGSSMAFNDLCRLAASHGYIVISPTHADSVRLRKKQKDESLGIDAEKEIQRLSELVDPADRLADIRLILDSLDTLTKEIPDLRTADGTSKMDFSRIAILGHSAGAFTAQLAMGVKARTSEAGTLESSGDPRIKAGILISPQSTGSGALTRESWNELSVPMLVVTGAQESTSFTDETPQTRREPFDLAKAGDKYLIYIQGATHSSFAGPAAIRVFKESPETDINTITDTLASGVLAFLDAYMKNDQAAKDYLAGEGIKTVSTGKAEVERK